MINTDSKPYRLSIGVMLLNVQNLVFVGHSLKRFNSWEMPQGGIAADEDMYQAISRELLEEIGTDKASLIAESSCWLQYDWPQENIFTHKKSLYCGQRQKWFLMRFTGKDSDIRLQQEGLKPEFSDWKWVSIDDLVANVVDFKKAHYQNILDEFSEHLNQAAA